MLLNNRRKRQREAQKQIEEEKELTLHKHVEALEDEVRQLRLELENAENERFEADKNRQVLEMLYDQEVINLEGELMQKEANQ